MRFPAFALAACLLLLLLAACQQPSTSGRPESHSIVDSATRIVTLNGSLSEILSGFGYERNIVGTDVTSTYPAAIAAKPKVGHNRNISAEAVIALKPNLVLGIDDYMTPELAEQLRATGARVLVFHREESVDGAKALIRAVADSLKQTEHVQAMVTAIDSARTRATALPEKPSVLFIYARGPGTLMAAGANTSVHSMIELAGARNAVTGYEDFKPLTTEALIAADPQVILLFSSGLESLGGTAGLMSIPGVKETSAGKAGRVVEMDGQLLTGFGPRTGEAIAMLSQKLHEALAR